MARSDNIRAKKVKPFFQAFDYAIDSMVEQAKNRENIEFSFNFIIIGCPVNIETLEKIVEKEKKQPIYQDPRVKALKGRVISAFNPIICVDFTDIKGAEQSE